MADYHGIYLQLDVLLLADLYEKFRTTCLEYYSFDPVHYYTTPGLAWDAVLKMSRVDLQLITDVEMYHFVENSIRGWISMISTRPDQANIPSFPDTCDSSHPNQNLIYLDANNLYGWAISQSLSILDFVFSSKNYSTMLRMVIYSRWIFTIDRSIYSSTQRAVFPESAPQRKLTPNLRDKVKYVVHYRN